MGEDKLTKIPRVEITWKVSSEESTSEAPKVNSEKGKKRKAVRLARGRSP